MAPYSPGDVWDDHYRGYELRINADSEIWWQVYNGTDRLHLKPKPIELIEQFLEFKPLGGRVRVTESGSVITRKEDEDVEGSRGQRSLDDYTSIYVGELNLDGDLVPREKPEYSIPVRPSNVSTGDLWPSVYDGARYSFSMDGRAWWHNPTTKKRHPVAGGLPDIVESALTRLKPEGGSFRVTPWGDVITLVSAPATKTVEDQFGDLPPIVRNIIKLRRERGDLQMLPIFVEQLPTLPLEVESPRSLTDQLTEEEEESLENWAASLGATSQTDKKTHKATQSESTTNESSPDSERTGEGDDENVGEDKGESGGEEVPMDDPVAWLEKSMEDTEKRINERSS